MFNSLVNFFYYLISFFIGLFFLMLGIICIILPWSPSIRTGIIEFILENSTAISLFGFGFLVIGIMLMVNLYLSSKRHYYYIRVGRRSISIDEEIIRQYLQTYWKQLFPYEEIPTRLVMKKNRIKVVAELPHIPLGEQKLFVERVQDDIQDIFSRSLGYPHDFLLSLSFHGKAS